MCLPVLSHARRALSSSRPRICNASKSCGPSVPETCGTDLPVSTQSIRILSFTHTTAHNARIDGSGAEKSNSASCADIPHSFAKTSGEGASARAIIAPRSLSTGVVIAVKHIPEISCVAIRRHTKPNKTIDFPKIPQYGTHRSMMRNVRVTDSSPDGLAARFSRPCDREFFIPNEVASYV
jgi:hypothetical protein